MGRAPETPLPRGSIGFRELWPNFNQVTADLLQDQLENWAIMDLDLRYTAKSTSNKVGWTSICGRIDRHRFIDSTNKDQIRFCKWWAGKTHNGRRFRDGYTKSDNSDGDDEDIDGNRTNSHQVADESQVVPLHIRGSHQEGNNKIPRDV
ncbi:hypothetical protein DFP72DRAFT_1082611 [Ephemerocybe angulata]|uniref:Uncharacterized protein n=1 Tax=Ephemerocybe angulata TaxID=980116 RepID=A0A8H6H9K2_9AGAR|nr:hypothetical protein DFP72DRAFT_1082611 [Tulosesus angulatus]